MIRIAAVDDEKECLERLHSHLKNLPAYNRDVFLTDGADLLIEKYKAGTVFDIVFLDIEMDSVTGIEAAKFISENYGNTIIIFTTSHNQYVKEAFYVNAFQYMFKPIEFKDFKFELERAVNVIRRRKHLYQITCNYEKTILECSDILYIVTRGRQLLAKTGDREYTYSCSIKDAEKELSQYGFSRIEQGALVNLNHVRSLDNTKVILDNGEEKYISRRLYKTFLSEFNLFVSKGLA